MSAQTQTASSTCSKENISGVEGVCRATFERLVRFVLYAFGDLQDALLSFEPVRRLVLYALAPECFMGFRGHLTEASRLDTRFEDLKYYVDPDAKQLILQACYHGLVGSAQPSGSTLELPCIGRVLVYTNCENSGRFQEQLARATARELGASIIVVDAFLLNRLAEAALGQGLDSGNGDFSWGGLVATVISWFLSGGRLAFVWDLVHEFCALFPGEVILFVKDVERTLGSSDENVHAFSKAFAKPAGEFRDSDAVTVFAGTSLREFGADRLTGFNSEESDGVGNCGSSTNPNRVPQDDEGATALFDLGFDFSSDRSSTWSRLSELFSVKVRLRAPPEGIVAVQHRQQLMEDAQTALNKRNYVLALTVGRRAGLILPDMGSKVYSYRSLAVQDWSKVLAWATHQEAYLSKVKANNKESKRVPIKVDSAPAELDSAATNNSPFNKQEGVRRRKMGRSLSAQNCEGFASGELEAVKQRLLDEGLRMDGSFSAAAPDDTETSILLQLIMLGPKLMVNILAWAISWLGSGNREEEEEEEEKTNPASSGEICPEAKPMMELLNFNPDSDGGPCSAFGSKKVHLKEEAIWYGLKMLDRSGLQHAQVKPENVHEEKLLADVLNPRELGCGFSEVGALSKAKDALREAVQLPLQHPELFSKGSLIQPPKGVLLFGPPGTGKTMLARAAAAECGASFLAVQPSSVLSKWVGEGVRNVRAVFSLAVKLSPCVVFVDEVDALLGQRHLQEHEAMRELKNELMAQWDGIRSGAKGVTSRVMVLGATNRPQDIDEAVLRRFSRRIFCDLPGESDIQAILEVMLAGEQLDADVDLKEVSKLAKGFSGSDLRGVCTAAAMGPVREYLAQCSRGQTSSKSDLGDGRSNGVDLGAGDCGVDGLPLVAVEDRLGTNIGEGAISERVGVHKLMMEDYKTIVASVGSGKEVLRKMCMADFKRAFKEVTPSVEAEGIGLQELKEWDGKFGDGAEGRNRQSSKLSYFM
ncbi:hypothetical protein BSKO_03686 [Bryopsis sp. KO-2023]|nr:hypothetical protein BSKO_03686 [Bryopsis sp. KO-2023]